VFEIGLARARLCFEIIVEFASRISSRVPRDPWVDPDVKSGGLAQRVVRIPHSEHRHKEAPAQDLWPSRGCRREPECWRCAAPRRSSAARRSSTLRAALPPQENRFESIKRWFLSLP
jgi:hypothetical protein